MLNIKKLRFAVFLIFIILTLALFLFAGAINYNTTSITNLLENYSSLAVIAYIFLIALAGATTLPITAVLIPGVIIFSWLNSLIYAMLGIMIGAFFTYFFSKYTGKDFLDEYSNERKKIKALKNMVEENAYELVIILNFVYFFPSNLAHIVAGITNLKFSKFLFATIAGSFMNTFAVILVIQGFYVSNILYVILGIVIIFISSSIPFIVYRKKAKYLISLIYNR